MSGGTQAWTSCPCLRSLGDYELMQLYSTRRPQRGPQHMIMQRLLTDLQNHASAWPFARPVNREEVQDYYDVSV